MPALRRWSPLLVLPMVGLWLWRDPPAPPRPAVVPGPSAAAFPRRAPAAPVERREVVEALPAETVVGSLVQDAMARPGDSDPRLLDALAFVGLSPASAAPLGALVDPWVAVGLVDLERQLARRCAARFGPDRCWDEAHAAEDEVLSWLSGPAAEAVARLRDHDSGVR